MLLDSKLNLEKAVTQARQSEAFKRQQGILQGTQPDPSSANLDQISRKGAKELKERTRRIRSQEI